MVCMRLLSLNQRFFNYITNISTFLQILYDFDPLYPEAKNLLKDNWVLESVKIIFIATNANKNSPLTLSFSECKRLDEKSKSPLKR